MENVTLLNANIKLFQLRESKLNWLTEKVMRVIIDMQLKIDSLNWKATFTLQIVNYRLPPTNQKCSFRRCFTFVLVPWIHASLVSKQVMFLCGSVQKKHMHLVTFLCIWYFKPLCQHEWIWMISHIQHMNHVITTICESIQIYSCLRSGSKCQIHKKVIRCICFFEQSHVKLLG